MKHLFFLSILLFLAACTPSADPAATATMPAAELAGTEWVLASLNGRSPLPNTRLTLTFTEDKASGFSGCNWYGGDYTASETGSLTIPQFASTERDCPEIEGAVAQEISFQEALLTAASYHLQTDRLEINNAAGDTILVFERKAQFDMDPADLVGTAWQLSAWDDRDLLPDTEITLIFDDAETMSGFAGCRHYNGRYTATGDDIRFPMLSMVESNCTQAEAVLIQEGNFTTALSETSNYQLADGQLILYTDPGAILRFAPRAETLETATPAPSFPLGAVHTPQDVQHNFDEWPSAHKQRLSDDLLVIFTYPHPLGDWVGGALIYDVPSVSAIVLDFNGRFNPDLTHYEDEVGQARLEEILADADLMRELQDEVVSRWLNPGSADSLSAPVTPQPTPTATPLPAPPPVISADGQWRAISDLSPFAPPTVEPPAADETEQYANGKYHVAMTVGRTDGSQTWTAVDEWRGWGLGWTYPEPVRWSEDGRTFYFANVSVSDGCAVLVNGGDLWRLDLQSGAVTEVAPYIGLAMALSPDETQLAVDASYGRGFLIRDLASGEEQTVPLPQPDDGEWQTGGLQWSPDGQHLLLIQVVNACNQEARQTAVVRIDVETLSATTLVEADDRNFTLLKWLHDDEVQLLDKDGYFWYLEVFSGEIARGG